MSPSSILSNPHSLPFDSVLIANRGEIAVRLVNAVRKLGLRAVTIFTSDDITSPHIRLADASHNLGATHALYSDIPSVLLAARTLRAGAIHPGYGFLSENADAVEAFSQAGIVWLGPDANTIRLFGLKHTARSTALGAGVPVLPGSEPIEDLEHARKVLESIGVPVLLKASAGGGGMGQAVVRTMTELDSAFSSVVAQARDLFAVPEVYMERFVDGARHVEVQVFGDGLGDVIALGDRDCSVQRRRQKVVEEAPAPGLPAEVRRSMREAAVNLCQKVRYKSAGTVEFVLEARTMRWYFLEVNTRLQVEHGVTELVVGVDIAQSMILIEGRGRERDIMAKLRNAANRGEEGVCIEARLYAENPVKGFLPCPGVVNHIEWPQEESADKLRVRVDKWAERGTVIAPHYDPLLGKLLAWGPTRPLAIVALRMALQKTVVRGVDTNIELLRQILEHPLFIRAEHDTSLLTKFKAGIRAVEVIQPGMQSSLQDFPGRVGYWNVGVSPSGPMDAYSMCMANSLVGNAVSDCALEVTVSGPTLLFHVESVVAVTGALFDVYINNTLHVEMWTPFKVQAGSTLSIGKASGHNGSGKVAYLAVRGGFDVPKYLGSASTFPSGKFGGLTGSFLTSGDFLPIGKPSMTELDVHEHNGLAFRWPIGRKLDDRLIPTFGCDYWVVAALSGPHASTDFFQEAYLHDLWRSMYEVHHATNRLGARLIGPVPKWKRTDGGSAGLHPSNLHDYAYSPGAVNFSGNTPIVIMMDGPSLGGFVCPITVATADFWKIAQAKPGERVTFRQVDFDQASQAMLAMEKAWDAVRDFNLEALEDVTRCWSPWWVKDCEFRDKPSILAKLDPEDGDLAEMKVVYRMSGDEHILVEYGEIELSFAHRLHVHIIADKLKAESYVKELCPGVRSLLVRYDRKMKHVNEVVSVLIGLESGVLGLVEQVEVSSRIIELPLAFEDRWTIEAQSRYLRQVRPDAPYMPSNVEFIRRINGLESVADVKRIMMSAEYMVLGLGDVYLGAPCAVPVDPRHRMVTSKYNPARTFTPEGAVGIGGAYMCIYGMDSPGGYQLTGRTLPIWDIYGTIPEECRGAPSEKPWLLRFFDRIKFFPVSDDELETLRTLYRNGDYTIKIKEGKFSYAAHKKMVEENRESIAVFERKRREAYDAERARWEAEGEDVSNAAAQHVTSGKVKELNNDGSRTVASNNSLESDRHSVAVESGISARVWSIAVKTSDVVEKGDELMRLESMKVEISIKAPRAGIVRSVLVDKGDVVGAHQTVCILRVEESEKICWGTIQELLELYSLGVVGEKQVLESCVATACELGKTFEMVRNVSELTKALHDIESAKSAKKHLPLRAIPFVVSEGINVEGSDVVQALSKAGAVLIGQTARSLSEEGKGRHMGEHSCAVAGIQRNAAAFAIVVDTHGSSVVTPAGSGGAVIGLRTTEGLLPVVDNEDEWNPSDSISIYAQSASDLQIVLDVCMRARVAGSRLLRHLAADAMPQHGHDAVYHGWTIGICCEDIVKQLAFPNKSDAAVEEYGRIAREVKQHGHDVTEVTVNCLMTARQILRDSKVDDWDQLSSKLDQKLKLCKRDADATLWSAVDALLLPVSVPDGATIDNHSEAGNGSNILPSLVTVMDLCCLSADLSDGINFGVVVVARKMKESVLMDIAHSLKR